MSAGAVVLVRHGQTAWNVAGRMQGQTDIPLDDVGVAQAARAAETLAGLPPAAVVASDLVRAADTARAVAAAAGLPVVEDARLRERGFGLWEGLDREAILAGWPAEHEQWAAGAEPDGLQIERRAAVGERVAAAVADHAGQVADGGTLVVVTHGAAISAGLTSLLGLDAGAWHGISGLGNCHWSVVHPTRSRRPAWRLSAHNLSAPG